MPHPNVDVIDRFYRAFAARDAEAMAACYAPNVHFSDPAFPDLHGDRARAMWRMLCGGASDLRVEHSRVSADDTRGAAHWEAWYTFSGTGRAVHNVIDAAFRFEGGRIVDHVDTFDFHRWAGQALGLTGRLLGGTGWLRRKVQRTAGTRLDRFIASPARP
jgi:ketosteroid isomerase-like protein